MKNNYHQHQFGLKNIGMLSEPSCFLNDEIIHRK